MALVAALGLAKHSVLLDVGIGFLLCLGCLSASGIRRWAALRVVPCPKHTLTRTPTKPLPPMDFRWTSD